MKLETLVSFEIIQMCKPLYAYFDTLYTHVSNYCRQLFSESSVSGLDENMAALVRRPIASGFDMFHSIGYEVAENDIICHFSSVISLEEFSQVFPGF